MFLSTALQTCRHTRIAWKSGKPIFIIFYKLKQKNVHSKMHCRCFLYPITCFLDYKGLMFQPPNLSRCNLYQYIFHISLHVHSEHLFSKLYKIFPCSVDLLSQEFWFYFQIDLKRGPVTLYYADLNDSVLCPNPEVFHNNANYRVQSRRRQDLLFSTQRTGVLYNKRACMPCVDFDRI